MKAETKGTLRGKRIVAHSREGRIERAVKSGFMCSMHRYEQIRREKNAPIAKYDAETNRAFLEYPDGRIEYCGEEA